MRFFGLIGKTLEHSFSAKYFKEKFEKEGIENTFYQLFPLKSIGEFTQLISDYSELSGLNVTIPYKQIIIPFLDELDAASQEIGAVNTIKFERKNNKLELYGYNTDYLGFIESIKPKLKSKHQKALILGTGGSSAAVSYALKTLNIDFKYVSRNAKNNNTITYESLNEQEIKDHLLIINTTPLGMFPNSDDFPKIPYQLLTNDHLLFDLIYNPSETQFLRQAHKFGAKTQNGLQMLQFQAEYSWKIWNEISF